MLLQENAMLGPYRVTGRIGEGGMGAVYRATDTRLGRSVAIKVLTAVTLSDKERLQRFEQEARATGMLNHPNLLTIYDVGSTEGTPYLVSELLEGETLRERLDRGAIPPRKAVDIALQIAHGLAAAHDKGIVHRDLKPENIYITREGRVKILDFGIAKLSPIAGKDGPTFQMASTEPGIVLGTVGYMSPEQIRGELVDRRSDIFAFGAIVYEMLTGSRAFKRESSIETLSAILKEEPPELIELNPSVPPQLEKLVRRCLEKDREQRFQSARDLAFNLETLSTFSSHGTLSGVANRHSPEARPVALADAELLAVSKSAELAILLGKDRLSGLGTLARVPVAGGTPREMADQVLQADWMPDAMNLAIIRFDKGKFRVESPIGAVLYETPHQIRDIRIAPDGNRMAFFEPHGDKIDLVVLDKATHTPSSIARGWGHGANGLAWAPNGKEIWVTGTDTAAPPALYAVDVDKSEMRLISRLTGSMKLFDISSAGRVLLANGMWRAALEYQAPGDTNERDLSWLDWSILADLSADGRTILFTETREGGGSNRSVYLRRADAPTPVKIGDGYADALSPNGKLVLCHLGSKLIILPTGSGEARELKIEGAFDTGAVWLPDSRNVILAGALKDKGYALHLLDTLDESEKTISPENIFGEAYRPFAISPDGRTVAGMTKDETIALYPIENGNPIAVNGTEKGEVPIQWSADGASLFVYRPTAMPAQVYKINLATGARELWKQFTPIDPAGVYKIAPICMTHDAGAYAYDAQRIVSDLYVAEGLR
ncbi:MAG TPA: WD40 repeat domain-containing serine/threonine protein kinase [Thermoanaerobaculia bacterium]